ncbi:MAG: RDD family protein [Xanthomonadales bacterium]|nr:RDD family protein [Xanthomonadales bacterium]
MSSMDGWYYRDQQQTIGPILAKELLSLFDSGRINPETPVRHEQQEWLNASAASVQIRYESYPHISEFRRILGSIAPRPTLRFLARVFDFFICWHLTVFSLELVQSHWSASLLGQMAIHHLPITFLFVLVLFEGVWINFFGTTPGKFLLSIHVRKHDGTKLSTFRSLQRALFVLSLGCGFFIHYLTPILLLASANHLQRTGHAPWDAAQSQQVIHFPLRARRIYLALTLFLWMLWTLY